MPSAVLQSVTKLIVLRGGNLGALTAETAAIENADRMSTNLPAPPVAIFRELL
jgi:hypothetical protein